MAIKGTKRNPERTRQKLIAAAEHVFARHGPWEATVEEITNNAGFAKGTFYLYFQSKEELLAELKKQFVDDILRRTSGIEVPPNSRWEDRSDAYVAEFVDFLLERRNLIQVFAQERQSADTRSIFAACATRLRAMLAAGIRRGIEAGHFSAADPDLCASLLIHAIFGTVQNLVLYERRIDRDRLIASVQELVRKTLAPSPWS